MPEEDGMVDSKSIKNEVGLKLFARIISQLCAKRLCGSYGSRTKLNIVKLPSVTNNRMSKYQNKRGAAVGGSRMLIFS